MSKYSKFFFPFLMLFLGALTFVKYQEIKNFKERSQEYSFVISANPEKISSLKNDLANFTYQNVIEEEIADNNYKITIRCPPDKMRFVYKLLLKFELPTQPN